jgi:hydroxyethylthiazole kinase-like uncharacterized protein yjeF
MGQPLFSCEQLRAIEQAASRGLAPGTLMQRAGLAAAAIVAGRLGRPAASVAVLCGGGNNGGDGYVCARRLRELGHSVTCFALAPPGTDDARDAAAAWRGSGGEVRPAIDAEGGFDAVVDALFGIGLSRPLQGRFLEAVGWIDRQRPRLVVALDVPSGLDADHGCWVGDVPGVRADATVTFIGAKPGLFTGAGRAAAGEVIVEELGLALPASRIHCSAPDDFATIRAPRGSDTHKGSFGNLGVLGGAEGMVGAALLAGRAALRLGAGRVFVECVGAPQLQFDPAQPELMLRALGSVDRLDAIVAGCGLGTSPASGRVLETALGAACPLVLDADALNLLSGAESMRVRLAARAAPTVLTPHPLEAARLLGSTTAAVQQDRLGAADRLARQFEAVVLIKGAGTVIAAPDGDLWINGTGGPALATPGTGDVLAGMIGALIAQGFDVVDSTIAGVWLHGAAADRHGADVGLVAGDVAPLAAMVLADLRRRPRSA